MGCGESKHVATGNTISRKNSRAESKRGKTSEAIAETSKQGSNTSSILVQEEGQKVDQDSFNSSAVADEGKDITESTELKKEENVEADKEKKSGVVEENEEPIQGIALEGTSGRSEYYSPREEAGKESLFNENVNLAEETKEKAVEENELAQGTKIEAKEGIVEDKKLAEETKEETVQEIILAEETKEEAKEDIVEDKNLAEDAKEQTVEGEKLAEEKTEETANGEPEAVKKENLVKETETAETTEAEAPTPAKKEEETAVASPAEDLKTE
ncbi:calponin homology domain-containing protein DDB_G0272472-like [Herrania umbratica]|uniref:Calponin homology domain-containing protein DDB_G0272472-like n=1 Tax=Herrania umbratica TaxID=108875 RepID=A0A6J1AU02_9ROSI|nr:calponin homology domain-containing protein DDB_G0272472-like [Herrania umbratica]